MRIIAYLALAAIDMLISLGRAISVTVEVVADFCMTPFRADYGVVREFVDRFILSAFSVLGLLKPEYDESLDTDGQNFTNRAAFDPLC